MLNNWMHWHKTKRSGWLSTRFRQKGEIVFLSFLLALCFMVLMRAALQQRGERVNVHAYTCTSSHEWEENYAFIPFQFHLSTFATGLLQDTLAVCGISHLPTEMKKKKKMGWWRICDCVLTYLAHQHTAEIHIYTAHHSRKIKKWRDPGKDYFVKLVWWILQVTALKQTHEHFKCTFIVSFNRQWSTQA